MAEKLTSSTMEKVVLQMFTFSESVEMTSAGFLMGRSWLVPHFLRFEGPFPTSALVSSSPCASVLLLLTFNFLRGPTLETCTLFT